MLTVSNLGEVQLSTSKQPEPVTGSGRKWTPISITKAMPKEIFINLLNVNVNGKAN